jgi:hypothetical protein
VPGDLHRFSCSICLKNSERFEKEKITAKMCGLSSSIAFAENIATAKRNVRSFMFLVILSEEFKLC